MNWTKLRNLQFRGFQFVPLALVLACFAAGGLLLASAVVSPRAFQRQHVTKHIEDVKVGDWVLAKDPTESGPPRPHQVVALPRNWTEHVVHVQVEGGGAVQATRGHPFYIEGRGWTDASELKAGDRLRDDQDRVVRVEKLWTEDRTADTFNLTVEGVHTYYVLAGDTPVLVHNLIIVTPGGTAIPIPQGAVGPTLVRTGKGFEFTGGSGGYDLSTNASNVRIMDPTLPKGPSPGYPNGYANYQDTQGQSIDQYSGKTVGKSDPAWHQPCQ